MGLNKRLISQADGIPIGPRITNWTFNSNAFSLTTPSGYQNNTGRGIAYHNGYLFTFEEFGGSPGGSTYDTKVIRKRNLNGSIVSTYVVEAIVNGSFSPKFLQDVRGLVIDSSGNMYIMTNISSSSTKLRKYNSSGVFQSEVTLTGTYANEIAIDRDNDLIHHGINTNTTIYIRNLSAGFISAYNNNRPSGSQQMQMVHAENSIYGFVRDYNLSTDTFWRYDTELGSLEQQNVSFGGYYFQGSGSGAYDSVNQFGYFFSSNTQVAKWTPTFT